MFTELTSNNMRRCHATEDMARKPAEGKYFSEENEGWSFKVINRYALN